MRRNLIAALLLAAGCAGSAKNEVAGGNTRLCSIADPQWASAARDFDRRSTLEVIAGLNKAARADLEQLKAGQRNDVGAQLDELYRLAPPSAFVSGGVAELGVRLRQLDCAVRSNKVANESADKLYAQILAELRAEQSTLDPSGGAANKSAAP